MNADKLAIAAHHDLMAARYLMQHVAAGTLTEKQAARIIGNRRIEAVAAALHALADENELKTAEIDGLLNEIRMRELTISAAEARAIAAEERVKKLETTLRESHEGWANVVELDLLPPQHRNTASILAEQCRAALAQKEGGS